MTRFAEQTVGSFGERRPRVVARGARSTRGFLLLAPPGPNTGVFRRQTSSPNQKSYSHFDNPADDVVYKSLRPN